MSTNVLGGTNTIAAEDEVLVKTYHASRFRSQISNVRSDGYLYVTNKRVIFRAVATDSVIHSEIPIDNVAGINLYYGEYRDWFRLLIFIVVVMGILGGVSAFGVVVMLSNNNWIFWGLALLSLGIAFASSDYISKNLFYSNPVINLSPLTQGILGVVATIFFSLLIREQPVAILSSLVSLVLTISTVKSIPRKYSMSLAIISKGGSSTPIMIAGSNPTGMVFSAAAQALEAEPGPDAPKLIRELGAIIHDIQTLGMLGLDRWKSSAPVMKHID